MTYLQEPFQNIERTLFITIPIEVYPFIYLWHLSLKGRTGPRWLMNKVHLLSFMDIDQRERYLTLVKCREIPWILEYREIWFLNNQIRSKHWSERTLFDFGGVPRDTEDLDTCNSITYIRDMKSTKERVLTNFGSRHKSSIFGTLIERI